LQIRFLFFFFFKEMIPDQEAPAVKPALAAPETTRPPSPQQPQLHPLQQARSLPSFYRVLPSFSWIPQRIFSLETPCSILT